ncbi:glucose-6-phosphate dehydrogenase [Paenibacillus hodogayensis]|uniref:Glucose-6-phosphate 1-dehydrogenase n=1 Tax=Paenibacillus hodogayensis TaxID=279208 RepID=A0ABV5VY41_9BACL
MEPTTFVLFGATGDLAKRKIYPALYNLFLDGKLPPSFALIGLGRRELSDETFRGNVERSIRTFSRRKVQDDAAAVERFLDAFRYCVLDVGRKDDYRKLLDMIESREQELRLTPNRLFYLSVGPEFFEPIAANIQESGLGSADGWKRLVIEKPFGRDLPSARDLNRKLNQAFAEHEIFRIDHYLGKPMVQKLEALPRSHPAFQALWTGRRIASVQITAAETVGVEERAGYYDHSGAIRDMFQNHMLQLLMMLAAHLPAGQADEKAGVRKKKAVQALRPLTKEEAKAHVVRGQYAAGTVQGTPVVGYTAEPGIDAESANDTFIAARLLLDDPFWRGVPFYIRTGKRMSGKSTRIVVEFERLPGQPLPTAEDEGAAHDLLVVDIGPEEGITLRSKANDPRRSAASEPIRIDLQANPDDVPEAYENLIGDALRGDATFFAHWDEVEWSWAWVQPILEAFADNLVPLRLYAAGSEGPAESDALLAENGHRWWSDSRNEQEIEMKEGNQYAYHANH